MCERILSISFFVNFLLNFKTSQTFGSNFCARRDCFSQYFTLSVITEVNASPDSVCNVTNARINASIQHPRIREASSGTLWLFVAINQTQKRAALIFLEYFALVARTLESSPLRRINESTHRIAHARTHAQYCESFNFTISFARSHFECRVLFIRSEWMRPDGIKGSMGRWGGKLLFASRVEMKSIWL